METVECNLCARQTATKTLESFASGIQVVECQSCGLVYQNPRPTADDLIEYYNGDPGGIVDTCKRAAKSRYQQESVDVTTYRKSRYQFMRGVFRDLTSRLPKNARVCDLGCGPGMLLEFMQSDVVEGTSNYKLVGIDPSVEAVKSIQVRGCELFIGTLESFRHVHEDVKFDCILMNDVFEHLPDPGATLELAVSMLTAGGVLYVRVPNVSGIKAKKFVFDWFPFLGRLRDPKGIWSVPDHTYNFTLDIMRRYADRAGLKVLHQGIVPFEIYSNNLRGMLAHAANAVYFLAYRLFRLALTPNIYVTLGRTQEQVRC